MLLLLIYYILLLALLLYLTMSLGEPYTYAYFILFLNTGIFNYSPFMGISWSPLLFQLLYVYMLEWLMYRLHCLICTQVCKVNTTPLGTRVLRGWENRRLKSQSSGLGGCSGCPWPLRAWESGPWASGMVSLSYKSGSAFSEPGELGHKDWLLQTSLQTVCGLPLPLIV